MAHSWHPRAGRQKDLVALTDVGREHVGEVLQRVGLAEQVG
jgi:hypothetical protein